MNLHKMIEICLKDDNMHIFVMINALICINNYVITCINSVLSISVNKSTTTYYIQYFGLIRRYHERRSKGLFMSYKTVVTIMSPCEIDNCQMKLGEASLSQENFRLGAKSSIMITKSLIQMEITCRANEASSTKGCQT